LLELGEDQRNAEFEYHLPQMEEEAGSPDVVDRP
jgi:hypothetical protein